MIFESPLWLFGLLALPALALLEAWVTARDRERTARLVSRSLWPRVLQRPDGRWRWVRLGLLMLGVTGLVLALARPQWGIVREKVEREGVDVVLVLDTSGSMATEDVPPNRFFLAQQALASLVARLEGDRFALVAFEGEAYTLSPLTLDADALGLFLDTMEPGIVPAPGTSLGTGIARGLELFVDQSRRNKVMVLVSDGEDLEGGVDEAVRLAKAAGVVVHCVGVGTEAGQPVPDFDRDGKRVGFKHDASGAVVISRLDLSNLEKIARGTGGRVFRLTPGDPDLSSLAATIEGMEQKSLAREYSYRRKERFQVPLAMGVIALALALLVPPPLRSRRRGRAAEEPANAARRTASAAALLVLLATVSGVSGAGAQSAPASAPAPAATAKGGGPVDELLLRPTRLTDQARREYAAGDHPSALSTFERAARARPLDPRVRFNLADGLYKNGKFDESAALYRSLGENPRAPLAGAARFNLGNARFQQQDYRGAIQAYRDALHLKPDDLDTRRNLELALRALEEQQRQQKQQQQQNQNQNQNQKQQQKSQGQGQQKPGQGQQNPQQQQQSKTPEERENERFREQAGMPKDRAMQLLDALQQNEKAEQKKLLMEKRAARKGGKDW
jgi:Ca-activated chloride channel family protein